MLRGEVTHRRACGRYGRWEEIGFYYFVRCIEALVALANTKARPLLGIRKEGTRVHGLDEPVGRILCHALPIPRELLALCAVLVIETAGRFVNRLRRRQEPDEILRLVVSNVDLFVCFVVKVIEAIAFETREAQGHLVTSLHRIIDFEREVETGLARIPDGVSPEDDFDQADGRRCLAAGRRNISSPVCPESPVRVAAAEAPAHRKVGCAIRIWRARIGDTRVEQDARKELAILRLGCVLIIGITHAGIREFGRVWRT